MNLLLLPDLLAMTLLVGVMMSIRSKDGQENMRLWSAGLMLILLECAAHMVYAAPRTSLALHRAAHVVALDSYLMAGALFLWSASTTLRRLPRSALLLWTNVAPHYALLTVYGFDLRAVWVYHVCVVLAIAAAVVSCLLLRRRALYLVSFAVIWTPLVISASVMQFRTTIYISLFFLYLLCAIAFSISLPHGSRGRITVVAGFGFWSLCFLTHPWVTQVHPEWVPFASQVWNMQKFIITVGLLLVMLERQVLSNEWLALHDELTDLPNRRLFDDRLQHALARASRDRQRVAILNLDLDGFKEVNDTFGHDVGDLVLVHVARSLEAATRRTDTLARLGGDEFSLIAVDIGGGSYVPPHPKDLPQIERLVQAMLTAVERPLLLGPDHKYVMAQVSASVGVAVFPEDGSDPATLLRVADQRMYEEKSGRHRGGEPPGKKSLRLQAT